MTDSMTDSWYFRNALVRADYNNYSNASLMIRKSVRYGMMRIIPFFPDLCQEKLNLTKFDY